MGIMTMPGAKSRWPELAGVASALMRRMGLASIDSEESPGARLDGGDVLRIGRALYVGRTARTNERGIERLRELSGMWKYDVHSVDVHGCLHLKSAATAVSNTTLLVNPAWLPSDAFAGFERINVDPSEPYAANALRIGDTLIFPAHFPKTRARLEARGFNVITVPCDELAKAEGAVTCCSILFES
jgi:dimethylargininase